MLVGTMMHQDAPTTPCQEPCTHRYVPVAEAVSILGLSATTIRRKIEAGELEVERVTRPQRRWLGEGSHLSPPASRVK